MAARHLIVASSQLVANLRKEVQKENASKYALLCSCASHQTTIDTSTGGIFSHYLIEAANKGIANLMRRAPTLTLRDIFPELYAQTSSYDGESAPRLYLGDTLPNFPFVRNTQFEHQRISLTAYMIKIIDALWNDGSNISLSLDEIATKCGKGAYGNHSKLSYAPWQLIEDVRGTKRKRRLTRRGRAFAQGKLRVAKAMIKDPVTNLYVAEPGAPKVGIDQFR